MSSKKRVIFLFGAVAAMAVLLASCGSSGKVQANNPGGPGEAHRRFRWASSKIGRKTLGRTLTLSSELVPYQEIDIYAKESGYVKELNVDYGSRVQANQVTRNPGDP